MKIRRNCTQKTKKERRGTATAELAVCLPAIVLIVFASIECCNMIYLKQALTAATYESARVMIRLKESQPEALATAQSLLASRNINNETITFTPLDTDNQPRGTILKVTASAPCSSNSITPQWFFGGNTMSVTTTMVKE
jgi:Flp pilus assembly protein TadG